MFQNWFTEKCTAYVDENGKALSSAALEAARHNPNARRCGHLVKTRAKFCSKCGSPTPKGWWRCGACGQWIGNESTVCPHCGKRQDTAARLDIAAGLWQKGDDVFAQRFDSLDVEPLMAKGLTVQEGQNAILLSGGAVEEVLPSGHYQPAQVVDMPLFQQSGEAKSFVMVDSSEIPFPVMVPDLMSKDDMALELTCVAVIQFDPMHPVEFLANVMGPRAYMAKGDLTACLGYDDLAHFILNDVDLAARGFCVAHGIDELFRDAEVRLALEKAIAGSLERNLTAAGLHFVRLKEVDFRGAAYERLRAKAGEVEEKRRENEFILAAQEMANDATKREAMGEQQIEEFMAQLAQEKQISDMTREHELEHIRELWRLEKATDEQEAQNSFEEGDVVHDNKLKSLQQDGELERRRKEHDELVRQRLAEQRASREVMAIEMEIQHMKAEQELDEARKWLAIKKEKDSAQTMLEIERAKGFQGIDLAALAASIEDPIRAENVRQLAELQMKSKMSPELLLAVAAASGVPEAAQALSNANAEVRAAVEKACKDNREIYEKVLAMNERMFNKAAESMEKGNASVPGTTIVK